MNLLHRRISAVAGFGDADPGGGDIQHPPARGDDFTVVPFGAGVEDGDAGQFGGVRPGR